MPSKVKSFYTYESILYEFQWVKALSKPIQNTRIEPVIQCFEMWYCIWIHEWSSHILCGHKNHWIVLYSRTLTNDHPHQRPSLSYDHISCDGEWFLFVYESLTSDHPSYTTTPMWFWGWSYKRGSTVSPLQWITNQSWLWQKYPHPLTQSGQMYPSINSQTHFTEHCIVALWGELLPVNGTIFIWGHPY